nr:syntaxin-81 isoform X1 [Tanacetum cinerariifolium]
MAKVGDRIEDFKDAVSKGALSLGFNVSKRAALRASFIIHKPGERSNFTKAALKTFPICLAAPAVTAEFRALALGTTISFKKRNLGRLLPHARGLGFKPRRGGFPSGVKKEWGLSPKAKVRVLHTAQLDVIVCSNH